MQIRIYYEDTDAGGVVYYANYLGYFERSRTEFFRELGIDILDYIKKNITFIVVRVELDYKLPGKYGDLLEVETELIGLSKASFELRNIIKNKENNNIIVQGITKLSCLNEKRKPCRLPEEFVAKLSGVLKKNQ